MEFSDLGKHCKYCNRQDYLPFLCDNCNEYMCKDHRRPLDHECKKIPKNKSAPKIKQKIIRCKKCKRSAKYKIACNKCTEILCEAHRLPEHHDCKLYQLKNTNKIKHEQLKQKHCREEALSMAYIKKHYGYLLGY